jgi:hypothetical protein
MLCFLLCYCLLFLHPAPSYFQSPESNQDNTSDNDANLMKTMTSNNSKDSKDSKDSNDTINNTMAKSFDKSMAFAAAMKSAKNQITKKLQGWRPLTSTPPQGRSRVPPPQPCTTSST